MAWLSLERATVLSHEGLDLYRKLGERAGMLQPLFNLGLAAVLGERHDEALALLRQRLQIAQQLGYTEALIYFLEESAAALGAIGETERATTLLGASEVAAEATGVRLEPFERELHGRTLELLRTTLDEEAFAAAWATGRQLTPDEATGLALADVQVSPRVSGA